jgi:hypothetical protein
MCQSILQNPAFFAFLFHIDQDYVSAIKIIGGLKSTHIDGRGRIRVPMDKSGYVDNKEPLPTYPRLDHRGPSRHLPTA